MTNSYVLVNPHIQGEFKNKIQADNSTLAAKIFYKNLSEHFNNAVPKFYFTIQKGGSGKGKYYHFESKEKKNDDEVSFTIKPYNMKTSDMTAFKNRLDTFKNKIQKGGDKHKSKHRKHKKHDSSESDTDSSDSESYIKNISTYTPLLNQPIYYWWYDPYVYNLNSIFIPTFYPYVTPLIEYSLILGP
jgi:hypothetical protein